MANNYTQLSFAVEMPEDHIKWCRVLHGECENALDAGEDLPSHSSLDKTDQRRCYALYITNLPDIFHTGVEMRRDQETSNSALRVFGGEEANVKYVAEFFQTYLRHFGIKDKAVTFFWARSHPRVTTDEFSGGACVVTHDAVEFLDSDAWAAETSERFLKGATP